MFFHDNMPNCPELMKYRILYVNNIDSVKYAFVASAPVAVPESLQPDAIQPARS